MKYYRVYSYTNNLVKATDFVKRNNRRHKRKVYILEKAITPDHEYKYRISTTVKAHFEKTVDIVTKNCE